MRFRRSDVRRGLRRAAAVVLGAAALALCPLPGAMAAGDVATAGPWLGLNGNSAEHVGPLEQFVEHGVIYDRSGAIELIAGETLAQDGAGLARSIRAGMIPVIPIEFDGYQRCTFGKQCLPLDGKAISTYAEGFISTAEEIIGKYPAAGVKFEAINEPWGYGTAAEYAAFLAVLLPRLAHSHIPLEDVYVGATGDTWVKGLYEAQPQLRSEIRGWYLHPYAKERKPDQGMAEVPAIRSEMASGQNNLIVSEIGFCAVSVDQRCLSTAAPAYDPPDAAKTLEKELMIALADHRAGWLRAAIVYSRSDGGWAMDLKGGQLTDSGEMLLRFADRYG
jgi:hypothetical protein